LNSQVSGCPSFAYAVTIEDLKWFMSNVNAVKYCL
jgi:hypothetical protein